jgi:hypothetical protein
MSYILIIVCLILLLMWTHESLIDFLRNDSKVIIHAGVHLGCVGLNVHDDVAKRGCKLFL